VGKQTFFTSPQIANLQVLGFIPQSQIYKFLGYASSQIANPQICIIILKIENPKFLQSIAQLRLKTVSLYHRERILETSTLSCNEEEEEITKPPKR
jgi:hypothetical protein